MIKKPRRHIEWFPWEGPKKDGEKKEVVKTTKIGDAIKLKKTRKRPTWGTAKN